ARPRSRQERHIMRRSIHISALLLAAAGATACGSNVATPAAASGAPSITINDILQIDQAGQPIWSPDGSEVGFQWGLGTERDWWAASASASKPASRGDAAVRQVAPLTGRASTAISPDWRSIAYVSKKHVWTVPAGGGRPVRVTNEEGKYSTLTWSPDSKRI